MSDSSGAHPKPGHGVCPHYTLALHKSHASGTLESLRGSCGGGKEVAVSASLESLRGSFGGGKEVAVSALNLNFFAFLGLCLILKRNFLSGANLWGKENTCAERDVLGKRVLCFLRIIEE